MTSPQNNTKSDLVSGFLVFLIALPLCLGISIASGFPPVAGILTAIIGGMVVSFVGSSRLTIKGPAAGLIVIAAGAVNELGMQANGQVDIFQGYRYCLAIGVGAAVLQIIFAFIKAGNLGKIMPPAVIHGMLAAIGVIIITKQFATVFGSHAEGGEALELIKQMPHAVATMNPLVGLIGVLSLVILFVMPMLKFSWAKKIPAPLLVLSVAIPLGLLFNMGETHSYAFRGETFELSAKYLVDLPNNLLKAITFPDFSKIFTFASIKYIIMFALVGSVEGLLTVSAVDGMDPEKKNSDLNKDLLATGLGNLICGFIGGLPMISEVVRSKANIDNGAKTKMANFYHGMFLLIFVAFLPGLLKQIPLAALAAMLVYTGTRLAAPSAFRHVLRIGKDQFILFLTTFIVTLGSDLLIGVGVGIALKVIFHLKRGASFRDLFNANLRTNQEGQVFYIDILSASIFSNFLQLQRCLDSLPEEVNEVIVDFSEAPLIDHTVLDKLHGISNNWGDRSLHIRGCDSHSKASSHKAASHYKKVASNV